MSELGEESAASGPEPMPAAVAADGASPALFDALLEGLLGVRQGRVLWANRSAAGLVGVEEPAELVGRRVEEILVTERACGRSQNGDDGQVGRLLRAGGGERRVRIRAVPAAGSDETVWVIRDATGVRIGGVDEKGESEGPDASRRLEEALREVEELRAQLAREALEREELLTVVSHELRTPVTVIAGFNRLLLSESVGALNEEQRHFLSETAKSCRRLNAFIGNLIEAAREKAGEGPLRLCDGSLSSTVEGVAAFLKPLLDERRLTLDLDLAPDATRARFDPMRVEQVLTNLIGNALKYCRAGGRVEIATRRVEGGRGEAFVEVAVSDEGPGIRPEDRQRIFEPYVRAGEGSKAGGLGLGLAICRRIVAAHGGSLGVDDAPGGGSRFLFTLPAAGPKDAPRGEAERSSAGRGAS